MTKTTRACYMLQFKRKTVRLVESGQNMAAARTLDIVEQTLLNRFQDNRRGKLSGVGGQPVSADQMKTARLRAELARVKMERDILEKAPADFSRTFG